MMHLEECPLASQLQAEGEAEPDPDPDPLCTRRARTTQIGAARTTPDGCLRGRYGHASSMPRDFSSVIAQPPHNSI